ncbi:glutaredoxin [Cystobasidium minutum MCA 4210]|uniref:glutaredoxin n=1 Tax=Cystobasidium minutum MCA 4210 TaxID=1397322 RepID=UPI0034CD50B8|eukprot:jgi/Rhomi1/156003/estExt_Genewise1.C_90249
MASQMRTFTTLLSSRSIPRASATSYARLHQAGSPSSNAFRRFLSDDTRNKIQQAVDKDPLVIFMKGTPQIPQCGFSRAVIQIMDIQGVPKEKMQTYNCLEDQELREGIKEFSTWPTIPQIYLKGEFLGGCDLILGMHQSGELTTMLQESGIIDKSQPAPTDADAS